MESLIARDSVLYRWSNWSALVGLTVLVVLSCAIVLDVLLRWLFNSPIEGLEDAFMLTIAIVLSSCFPAVLIQGHNITIRFLGLALGRRASVALDVFGHVGTLIFICFITYQLAVFSGELGRDNRITEVIEIPMAPFWWFTTLLVGACIPVQLAILAVNLSRVATGRIPEQEDHQKADYMDEIQAMNELRDREAHP